MCSRLLEVSEAKESVPEPPRSRGSEECRRFDGWPQDSDPRYDTLNQTAGGWGSGEASEIGASYEHDQDAENRCGPKGGDQISLSKVRV